VLIDNVLVDSFKLNMYIHAVSRVLYFFTLAVSPYPYLCRICTLSLDWYYSENQYLPTNEFKSAC